MEFGLWFEPEMVNPDSDLARAHPEWMMAARAELPLPSRHQQVLDLTVPEAYAHIRGQILALLDEYDISYIKWDHNRDLLEAGQPAPPRAAGRARPDPRGLPTARRDPRRAPRRSRSSPAPRVAHGSTSASSNAPTACGSPTSSTPWNASTCCAGRPSSSRRSTWAPTSPPDHSHSTGRMHHLSFRAGTAIFGHLGIEWDLTTVDDDVLDEIAQWIGLLQGAPSTSSSAESSTGSRRGDENVFVHGVVAPDRSEALFALATVGTPLHVPGPRIRFTGLAPQARYRVRPVVVGTPPSGLVAPQWWGEDEHARGGPVDPAPMEHERDRPRRSPLPRRRPHRLCSRAAGNDTSGGRPRPGRPVPPAGRLSAGKTRPIRPHASGAGATSSPAVPATSAGECLPQDRVPRAEG